MRMSKTSSRGTRPKTRQQAEKGQILKTRKKKPEQEAEDKHKIYFRPDVYRPCVS